MYAIVEIAGKQYKVQEDDKLFVPHLANAKVDDTIEFDRVLLVTDGDDVQVGTPVVADAAVSATVLEHVKADKILVFRKIRRKRFKVKKGHRQRYTQIQVGAVSLNGEKQSSASKEQSAESEAESTAAEAKSSAAAAKESGKTEATEAKTNSATKDSGSPEAKQDEPKETTVSKKGGDDETKDSADAAGKKKSGKSAEKEGDPQSDAGPKQAQDADESGDSDDEKSS